VEVLVPLTLTPTESVTMWTHVWAPWMLVVSATETTALVLVVTVCQIVVLSMTHVVFAVATAAHVPDAMVCQTAVS
jgi:hypothetical protein